MADVSLVTDTLLPTASETFTDNLSSSIAANATIVPVNSAVEYADGDVAVLTVDPGTANEATFVGKKDVGANQFIDCVWTEGNTAVGHDAGATIIDYDSATHYNLVTKSLKGIMNQNGTLKDQPIRDALGLSNASQDGWEVFPYTLSVVSGYNQGNNSYELTVANQDVTNLLSPGMRLRVERGTTAPTQCTDLEKGSSQYWDRASGSLSGGLTSFTDDWTVEAWINIESYQVPSGNQMRIASRYNSTGWIWGIDGAADGSSRLAMEGYGSNSRVWKSYASVPKERWVHVATSVDMSGASCVMYINGISVSVELVSGTGTSITQNGNFMVGNRGGGTTDFFNGKICDVRVWNVVRTATEIRDNMNQALVGSETNLVGYWKFDGDGNDSTSSANHLTGQGGAVATTVDHPFKNTEYAIITKVAYSAPNTIVTVFTGTDHNIPNMTLSAPYYSTQRAPYGFPASRGKWFVESIFHNQFTQSSAVSLTRYNIGNQVLELPNGDWDLGYISSPIMAASNATILYQSLGIGSTSTEDPDYTTEHYNNTATTHGNNRKMDKPYSVSAQTSIYLLSWHEDGTSVTIYNRDKAPSIIRAYCGYV